MRTFFYSLLMATIVILGFAACSKADLSEETVINPEEANSLLQVRTRAGATGEVSYPVKVYVFSGEKCVAVQTIASEDETLNIPLQEGSYSVYAIGGASSENYILPTQENATPSMTITLQAGKSHGDLMAAKSNVVLVDGGTNVLTLSMERKVMLLQSVVVNNIPSEATAVSVSISPLYQGLAGTSYVGESGMVTVSLTKQAESQTWQFTGSQYLLPPSTSPATIMVNIVKPSGTTIYTYNTSNQLEAGYKINIQGTYTEAMGVTLTGTITGAIWKGEQTISFEFNEKGSQAAEDNNNNDDSNNDNNDNTGDNSGDNSGDESGDNNNGDNNGDVVTGTIPEVGDTYEGCYVVSVEEVDGGADVLLLSPIQRTVLAGGETKEEAKIKVEAALPNCAVDGINGWRVMTLEEATIICKSSAPDLKKGSENRYLIEEDGVLKPATFGIGTVTKAQSFAATNLLRPVATIRIQSE